MSKETPTPGVPLSAEGVQERVEKIVREDFYAGPMSGSTQRLASALIRDFRLTTPSDQGEEDGTDAYRRPDTISMLTTPASGSDGLETVAWVRKRPTWDFWTAHHGKPGDEEGWIVRDVVTREAAEKRIGELERAWLEAEAQLSEISAAIGTTEFMDPPDGGDVSLAEQVRRMNRARLAAESQVAALKAAMEKFPCSADFARADDFMTSAEAWWKETASPALALKEGR